MSASEREVLTVLEMMLRDVSKEENQLKNESYR